MPLLIVRNDITKMRADAIVNSTNTRLVPGGTGVDAGIHAAAGDDLARALRRIGTCPAGSAVVTDSFGIDSCRYIIHTVGPVYIDGRHGERQTLESCYRKIFSLAKEYGCASLAVPVLCSGANGYPKREAYGIAAACARNFLIEDESDMMIFLVVFDEEMVDVSEENNNSVMHLIPEEYPKEKKEMLAKLRPVSGRRRSRRKDAAGSPDGFPGDFGKVQPDFPTNAFFMREAISAKPKAQAEKVPSCPRPDFSAAEDFSAMPDEREDGIFTAAPCSAMPDYRREDRSFGEMCLWWMEKKNIKPGIFYGRSNLTRGAFYNIRKHPEQSPKKTTAFACVIGLGLTQTEAEDLLMRAGLAFSPYYKTDAIVREYISRGEYDIDAINLDLFEMDLAMLGSVT